MDAEPCAAANRIYWGNYHDPQVKPSLVHRHAFNADMPALQKDCPFALEIAFPEQVDLVDMVPDSFDRDQLQSELAHEKLEWHNKAMLALLERSRAAFDRAVVKATTIAVQKDATPTLACSSSESSWHGSGSQATVESPVRSRLAQHKIADCLLDSPAKAPRTKQLKFQKHARAAGLKYKTSKR